MHIGCVSQVTVVYCVAAGALLPDLHAWPEVWRTHVAPLMAAGQGSAPGTEVKAEAPAADAPEVKAEAPAADAPEVKAEAPAEVKAEAPAEVEAAEQPPPPANGARSEAPTDPTPAAVPMPEEPFLLLRCKRTSTTSWKAMIISLDGLLDYDQQVGATACGGNKHMLVHEGLCAHRCVFRCAHRCVFRCARHCDNNAQATVLLQLHIDDGTTLLHFDVVPGQGGGHI